jgi:VWFA-related protein
VHWLAALLLLGFQDPATFTSEVTLVHVDVEVRSSGDERLIEDLTKDDFRIKDNGDVQPVLSVGRQEEPLDVILLLDTSASMRPVIERVADAARTALAELREGDRVAVMAFDRDPELAADFTSDFESVERVIRERVLTRQFPMSTQIQEAADAAARHFLRGRAEAVARRAEEPGRRRRAVLIVTDNLGVGRESQALDNLWEADAVLSGVIVRSVDMTIRYSLFFPPSLFGAGGMSGLAEKTGGDTISMDDAGEGLRRMIERLRLRYSLYYAMPAGEPGKQRKIKVELTGEAARFYKDAKVRARSGYRIP